MEDGGSWGIGRRIGVFDIDERVATTRLGGGVGGMVSIGGCGGMVFGYGESGEVSRYLNNEEERD